MVEIEKEILTEIVAQALKQGQRPFVTISSNSMVPLLKVGDDIQLAPASAQELTPGEIVVLETRDGLLAHRFLGLDSKQEMSILVTKGDRLGKLDPPIISDKLIGRVISRRRGRQTIYLDKGIAKFINHLLYLLSRGDIKTRDGPIEAQGLFPNPEVERGDKPKALSSMRLFKRFRYLIAFLLTTLVDIPSLIPFRKQKS
jgi:signal peptidase I